MVGGLACKWPVAASWEAALTITATVFAVPRQVLAAESRGRGPRPPKDLWLAKKIAVYLAVVLSDCDYAALARHVGLHKDTVATHCASMREACAIEPVLEAQIEALTHLCALRLTSLGNVGAPRSDDEILSRIHALEAQLRVLASSDAQPTMSVSSDAESDHENVIEFPGTTGKPA